MEAVFLLIKFKNYLVGLTTFYFFVMLNRLLVPRVYLWFPVLTFTTSQGRCLCQRRASLPQADMLAKSGALRKTSAKEIVLVALPFLASIIRRHPSIPNLVRFLCRLLKRIVPYTKAVLVSGSPARPSSGL